MHKATLTLSGHGKQGANQGGLGFVSVLYSALALELYLKALIAIEGKIVPRNNHNLWKLFTILSRENQTLLRTEANAALEDQKVRLEKIRANPNAPELLKNAPTGFNATLKKCSDVFTEFRNFMEPDAKPGGWYADPILAAAHRALLKLNPAWEHSRYLPSFSNRP
jgi:hypothetical protein